MASVKVKYRPSTVDGQEGSICYQIIHERKVRQITTSYKILPTEWDETKCMVNVTSGSERQAFLSSIRERIRWDVERLNKIVRRFNDKGETYEVDAICEEFQRYASEHSFLNYMESAIARQKQNGKNGIADKYRSSLNSFKSFLSSRGEEDILLESICAQTMVDYEAYLHGREVTPNTSSFYMRNLRAVYNRAVEDGLTEQRNPFRRVYTGIGKTVKRALPIEVIKKIKTLDLSCQPKLDYARDMFMMSFYLRGMSFIDLAYLKKTDLKDGYVTYRRRKTNQKLTIKWTKGMQEILDKYPVPTSDYLMPVIMTKEVKEHYAYRNAAYKVNRHLKKIAELVGISAISLTHYAARHSWASAARAKGIPLSVISEGLGHDSEATTQIYLASLDTSVVDKANDLILESL